MAALETLDPTADTDAILTAVRRDGAVIIRDALDANVLHRFLDEAMPFIERTGTGRDDFSGRLTQRTGALVARCPAARDIVMHAHVLEVARAFLAPFCSRILLHLTQTIRINPGQGTQVFHRDRDAWGGYLPREIEPQFNTIWALTDFTTDNGATRVVPGSPGWDEDRRATPEEQCQAVMSKGSVLLYTGSVIHSGGENCSEAPRIGLNITYCLGWLRQEENQYLSCPPKIARTLPEDLQELLGYTMGSYALGYYSDPSPNGASGRDLLPPEAILGRGPRTGLALDAL